MDYLLVLGSLVVMAIIAFKTHARYKHLPPGPTGLPLVGYIPFMGKEPHITLTKVGQKYGSLFSINLGITRVVVLHGWDAFKEALVRQADTFAGRPNLFMLEQLYKGKDVVFTDCTPTWKEHRKFTVKLLRNFGIGQKSLEDIVRLEANELIECLTKQNGQCVEMTSVLGIPITNVIWRITANDPTTIGNEHFLRFRHATESINVAAANTGFLNFIPYLRHLVPGKLGYDKVMSDRRELTLYLERTVDNHKEQLTENMQPNDFIDGYLLEITRRTGNTESPPPPPYDRDHLLGAITNMFMAGVETIEYTLRWAFLQMALRPDIQAKVQEELKNVVGTEHCPPYWARDKLPYTEATVLEIHRFFSIVPLGVPHSTTKDTELLGYKLPKGTIIFPNQWAIHHNQEHWGDPECFRPERFLDDDGRIINTEHVIPFSLGTRFCIGESLARLELFVFFTSLLQRFTFELPDQCAPSMQPIFGVNLSPQPYRLNINCRS